MIKNDIEYILMERKPGGYRKPIVGDVVPDPFSGSRTTMLAAINTNRNNIGIEREL